MVSRLLLPLLVAHWMFCNLIMNMGWLELSILLHSSSTSSISQPSVVQYFGNHNARLTPNKRLIKWLVSFGLAHAFW